MNISNFNSLFTGIYAKGRDVTRARKNLIVTMSSSINSIA